jgi:hypothetical protein
VFIDLKLDHYSLFSSIFIGMFLFTVSSSISSDFLTQLVSAHGRDYYKVLSVLSYLG